MLQNILSTGLMNLQPPETDTKKPSAAYSGFVKFKDILNGSIAQNKSIQNENKNTAADHKQAVQNKSAMGQVRRYRDIAPKRDESRRAEKINERVVPSFFEKEKEVMSRSAEEFNDSVNSEVMLESMSNILGVSSEQLKSLLGFLGINADDLANPQKSTDTVHQIALKLGLENRQETTLIKLLDAVVKQINTGMNVTLTDNTGESSPISEKNTVGRQDWVNTNIKDIKVYENTTSAQQFSALISELKEKLKVLSQKMEQDPSSALKEIFDKVSAAFDKLLKENALRNTDKALTAEEKPFQMSEGIHQPEKTDKDGDENVLDFKKEEKTESNEMQPVTLEKAENKEMQPAALGKSDTQATVILNASAKTELHDIKAEAANTGAAVERSRIISQIVEKAMVVLNADKSEMVMDLKPDSLGKLSIKVVTEHGIVMAKFEAESQQVKQVLESNMQLLKDSLEKQGLMVQGFSVSVKDNRQESSRKSTNGRDGGQNVEIHSVSQGITAATNTLDFTKINPYMFNQSSIDLTA